MLDRCGLNYSVTLGNHDWDIEQDNYEMYDKYIDFGHNTEFAGSRLEGRFRDTYHLVPSDMGEVLILSLKYMTYSDESGKIRRWARDILEQYSDHPAVIVSHYTANDCADFASSNIRHIMEDNCNVLAAFGGHGKVILCNSYPPPFHPLHFLTS